MTDNKEIYILTETYEGNDGIREFEILNTSLDIEKLKMIMQDKIQNDDYEFIKKNGIKKSNDIYFITFFVDGFIEYSIIKKEII